MGNLWPDGTLSNENDWLSDEDAGFVAGAALGVAVGVDTGVAVGLVAGFASDTGLGGGDAGLDADVGLAADAGLDTDVGLVADAGLDTGAGLTSGPDTPVERSGAPQRGQDLLDQEPRLEPHEVQNM
jgi:hypothetical protein